MRIKLGLVIQRMADKQINDELIERLTTLDELSCEAEAIALGQQEEAGLSTLTQLLTSPEIDIRFGAERGLWTNGSPCWIFGGRLLTLPSRL